MRSATPKHPTAPFDTEGEAVEYLAALMESMNWRFKQEYELKNRTRVDFVLVDAEGDPVVGIEVKRRLGAETPLSEFSDYFEQCESYARKLGVPVYIVWRSGSHYRREAWRPHNGQIASAYGSTQVRRPMA